MALSRDEVHQTRIDEAKRFERAQRQVEERKKHAMNAVEKKYNKILDEIRKLEKEKHEIQTMPITKEEVLKQAKESLKARRDAMIETWLKDHLASVQKRRTVAFDPNDIRLTFQDNSYRLAYFSFTNKHLEKAVSQIEEPGISEMERRQKVQEIDEKIAKLYEKLEAGK
jgi:hypothetical protein